MPVSENGVPLGTTPGSATLAFAAEPYQIAFGGAANGGYVVPYAQVGGRTVALFYNKNADTLGNLGSISATSVGARPAPMLKGRRTTASGRAPSADATVRPAYSTRVLYAFVRDAGDRSAESILQALGVGARAIGRRASDGAALCAVAVPAGETTASARQRLRGDSRIVEIDPVPLLYPAAASPVTPNNPGFQYQWDFTVMQVPYAWGYTEGSPTIAAAVIDGGYDSHHPQLASKVTYSESVLNGVVTAGPAAAQDTDGHGSFVSGIIASATNDGSGYAGVGWNVALTEFKVLPNGGGGANASDVALAVNDAVSRGAKVINISLAASPSAAGPDPGTEMAIDAALAAGITVVAAAGNDGAQVVSFPAADPGVISVGSSAIRDNGSQNLMTSTEYVPTYSNGSWSGGSFASLIAPGGDPAPSGDTDYLHWITNDWTTMPSSGAPCVVVPTADTGCGYELGAGTSAAAPHVSGVVALMLSKNPNLTPAQIGAIVSANADDIGDPHEGAGRLNAYRALAAVSGDTPPSRPTAVNFVAIAFTASPGTNRPTIVDATFTAGQRLPRSGAFRIADVRPSIGNYYIGLWYDANGDGIVDAGDYFGYVSCSTSAPCAAASSITVHPIAAGFSF